MMVSLMESVSLGGEAYWRRPMLEFRALSDVTYGQQAERIQQEEQYRHEMMRQRQEINRRQMDLYQRLQVPQYPSQDTHIAVSTWQNQSQASPNLSSPSQTSPNLSCENPLFGPAPVVRNLTSSSIKEILGPLTVDCSVEYELPDFLKVATKEGPPLLMIQNQRNETSFVVAAGAWTQTKCDIGAWTQTKLHKASATHLPATRSHLKLFKSPTLNKSQSGRLELTAKLPEKRKFHDVRNPDIGHGLKRQKMMALTPPDLVSVAHLLETPSTYFHQPRQSIKYSHKSITLSHPPSSHSHKSTSQSLPPSMQSQSSTSQSHTMPKLCSTTNQPTSNAARNINWHSGRTANQQPVSLTDQQTINATNQQPSAISGIHRTSSLSNSDFLYPAMRRDGLGSVMHPDVMAVIGNYQPMYHQPTLPIKTNIFHEQMFHKPRPIFQKQRAMLQKPGPVLQKPGMVLQKSAVNEGKKFDLSLANYNYPAVDGSSYIYPEYKARGSCPGCAMCQLFC